MKDPVFTAFLKYKNQASTLAVRDTQKNSIFFFKEVTIKEIRNEINKLSSKKASRTSDVPTRIVKENPGIFSYISCKSIDASLKSPLFPISLKLAYVTQLVYFQLYQNFLKGQCLLKYLLTLIFFSQNTNADF